MEDSMDEYDFAMGEGRGKTTPKKKRKSEKVTASDDIELERHWFFNPWVYLILTCVGNVAYISAIGGYVSASLSTIERRFQLKSSESGAITIINDVAGMLAVLFVTHFGHSRHRPRIVGAALAAVGLGTIMCALPHFIYDPPQAMMAKMTGMWSGNLTGSSGGGRGAGQDTCRPGDSSDPNEETCDVMEEATSGSLLWQVGWILAGQVLCGLGTSAQPLCITYLDDNVKNKRTTTIFVAVIFSTFAFGPTLGYMVATACLVKPTFFHDPAVPPPAVSQEHPYYIGAWWLGFLINGFLLICISVPFFFFPKSMRKKAAGGAVGHGGDHHYEGEEVTELMDVKEREANNQNGHGGAISAMIPSKPSPRSSDQGFVAFLTDFFQTIKRIVTNLTAMSVFFAVCAEITGHVGWFIFGPKFMYTQYRLPPAKSSMLFGMMMLPGPIIGNLLAGLIVRKFKLSSKGCAKMVICIEGLLLCLAPTLYWLGCDNPPNAGVTTPYAPYGDGDSLPYYATLPPPVEYSDDLTVPCNADCGCERDFVPVCGSDGLTYATACHAGCRRYEKVNMGDSNTTLFVDCSCIPPPDNETEIVGLETMENGFAFLGECPWLCDRLYYFLGMMLFGSLFGSLLHNPSFMLQFRSHREEDRSTALGVSNVLMKVVAFIPGPVYFGAILEKTCLLFQEACGRTGNCLVYDIKAFRLVFTIFSCSGRVVAFILYCVAYFSVRKREQEKEEEEDYISNHPLSTRYVSEMESGAGSASFKHTSI
ncbi:solute carrier organic anion transporter family member 3A1-like [Diadema antillarum]|uniref:solute carrier organic anion transporter family member 3A1-like n=1 Tax=Diadema antillarum TaxID=105358 RepID=UPI003A86390D